MALILYITLDFFQVFWKIALLVTAIILMSHWARTRPWVRPLERRLEGWIRRLRFQPGSAVPLFAGFSLGIAYGAKIILDVHRRNPLPRKEVWKLAFFLSTAHAMFEDTLIFFILGANPWILVGVRMSLAIGVVWLLDRWLPD